MASVRAFLFLGAIVCFFLIGTPLQWLVARYAPAAARAIPVFFCRSLLRLAGVRVSVEGAAPDAMPAILASNHVSWIDILAFGSIEPFCFLAKSDVASWPLLSAFAKVQGTVFVDRQRRRSIPPANRQMAARMLEGRSILLFPEGTTAAGLAPGRFHSSHFAAARDLLAIAPGHREVRIQPVAITYSSEAAAWVGDDDLLSHLWRTLRAPPLRCRLTFGVPLRFTSGSDRKEIAVRTRAAVVVLLGRRASEVGQTGLKACTTEPCSQHASNGRE